MLSGSIPHVINDGNVIELTDAMLEKDDGFAGSKHIERN